MAEGVLADIIDCKRRDVAARLDGLTLDPEPTRRSLRAALARDGARFIMEVKKASPSGHRSRLSVTDAVDAYAPVADALSVLTDQPFFSGSLGDLRLARTRFGGPILAKDFIVDPRQVTEARISGADAVLAILSALDDRNAGAVLAEARRLGMDVVVEVHDEPELKRALTLGAAIIGINNRDLRTLRTDLSVTERLAALVPEDRLVISESGICTRGDVHHLSDLVDAFLVGSSLMASDDVAFAARSLVYGPVKICGLTHIENVAAAATAGATHAGLVFAGDSPRKVGAEAASLVDEAHARGLKAVGVFRNEPESAVEAAVEKFGLDAIQIHSSVIDLASLRHAVAPACEVWGVCGVHETAEPVRAGADRTLFDTRRNGRSGGTGEPFDWKRVAERPDLSSAFLAGGIGPVNARAAQQVGAFGVDVGSSVESVPGHKDEAKLKALFDALRPDSRKLVQCG